MSRIFAVLNADTNAARVAVKNAGCTHAVINANWDNLQPTGTGSLDPTATATMLASYDHALSIGLRPILAVNLQYPPSWILSGVEKFKDQAGNQYDTNGSGKQVRNWMWTAVGRTYVADLLTRIATALGPVRVKATDGVRVGGGWYGEVHYPEPISGGPTFAWQAFGASMQTGTGLAAGMTVCPVPGYVPYSGTDAQDVTFLNWYLNGIVSWVQWQIDQYKALGFTRNLWVLLSGYGVRANQLRTDDGYKQAAALGEDHLRLIGQFMHDTAVWPYSTWLDTVDGFAGGTVDSDKAAWKSIYEKALVRGKHYELTGENTGGENNTGMDGIFAGALGAATYAGSPGIPSAGHYYNGCVWLDYTSATNGSGGATLAHYASKIASV
jgi:hypothetical protein